MSKSELDLIEEELDRVAAGGAVKPQITFTNCRIVDKPFVAGDRVLVKASQFYGHEPRYIDTPLGIVKEAVYNQSTDHWEVLVMFDIDGGVTCKYLDSDLVRTY
jgi:hypothetical protein